MCRATSTPRPGSLCILFSVLMPACQANAVFMYVHSLPCLHHLLIFWTGVITRQPILFSAWKPLVIPMLVIASAARHPSPIPTTHQLSRTLTLVSHPTTAPPSRASGFAEEAGDSPCSTFDSRRQSPDQRGRDTRAVDDDDDETDEDDSSAGLGAQGAALPGHAQHEGLSMFLRKTLLASRSAPGV